MLKVSWSSNSMSLICKKLGISQINGVFFNKLFIAIFTCTFALGGAAVGAIVGAMKGHTTETGFSRGFVAGAVAGAVTGVQLMDLVVNDGEPFPTVALVQSLISGKIFMEWVSPALLKAYQWQISGMERSLGESDIFDVDTFKGLSQDLIKELPCYNFQTTSYLETSCTICLQNLKNGEAARWLGSCKHTFHVECIDEWLMRHASCPICRNTCLLTATATATAPIHNTFTHH